MSAALQHTPSQVLQAVLYRNRLTCGDPTTWSDAVTTGQPGAPWPVFADTEPDGVPGLDEVVTVYEATPQFDARILLTGEVQQHYGFTVRVRGKTQASARVQAERMRWDFNEGGCNDQVVTLASPTAKYLLQSIYCRTLTPAFREAPDSDRWVCNLNCLATLLAYPIQG